MSIEPATPDPHLLSQVVSLLQWLIGSIAAAIVVLVGFAFRMGNKAAMVQFAVERLARVESKLDQIPELVTAVGVLKEVTSRQQSDHRQLRDRVEDLFPPPARMPSDPNHQGGE